MTGKKILDVTCGSRSIWFQKQHPGTVYCDVREEDCERRFGKTQSKRTLNIHPDIIADFTELPFEDNSFALCVFDPPQILRDNLSENSWLRKKYGQLDSDWPQTLHRGFDECMRVLKPDGILILKWSEVGVSTRELINAIGQEPLFGHRSGKKMNTHWLTFMKEVI